jgi:hypothetical protein
MTSGKQPPGRKENFGNDFNSTKNKDPKRGEGGRIMSKKIHKVSREG